MHCTSSNRNSQLVTIAWRNGFGDFRPLTLALRRPEHRVIITRQQISGMTIDFDTSGLAQPLLGPAAAKQSNHAHICVGSGFRVMGSIAYNDDLIESNTAKLLDCGFENIGMRLGSPDVRR